MSTYYDVIFQIKIILDKFDFWSLNLKTYWGNQWFLGVALSLISVNMCTEKCLNMSTQYEVTAWTSQRKTHGRTNNERSNVLAHQKIANNIV